MLPKYSYLKIDSDYEVPIQMLVKERDCLGDLLMVWPKLMVYGYELVEKDSQQDIPE